MDLEKAFNRVPRDVLWWVLRQSGVDECIVRVIQSMYEGALTSVKLGVGESVEFAVKVGVHQGSVLSPLLFIIVLESYWPAARQQTRLFFLRATGDAA